MAHPRAHRAAARAAAAERVRDFTAQHSHECVSREILISSGAHRAVEPVRAVLCYQLIVDAQEQEGRGPLPNERRIQMFLGRFKKKRGQDRTGGSPQEKV
jgi:hypothetical protein